MTKRPRTVLHGVDQSRADFSDLPNKGNMASECYAEDLKAKHIYDAEDAAWLPMEYVPFRYDVAVDGGTVAAHALDVSVPEDTIVLDGIIEILRGFRSGGAATLKIALETDQDVLASTALGSLTEGLKDIKPVGTAATAIKTTATRTPTVTIGTAAMTEGVLVGFLRCVRGFPNENESSSSCSCSESSNSSSSSSHSSSSPSSSVEYSTPNSYSSSSQSSASSASSPSSSQSSASSASSSSLGHSSSSCSCSESSPSSSREYSSWSSSSP